MTTQIALIGYPCVTVNDNDESETKFVATFHLEKRNKSTQIATSDNIDEVITYALDIAQDLEIPFYDLTSV